MMMSSSIIWFFPLCRRAVNQFVGASSASFFNTKGLNVFSNSDREGPAATGALSELVEAELFKLGLHLLKKLAIRVRDLS